MKRVTKAFALVLSVLLMIVSLQAATIKADELTTICIGWTKQLSVDTKKPITWQSTNTKVATVSKNGLVTGKGIGTTVISAKYGNNVDLWAFKVAPAEEEIIYEYDVSKPIGIPATKTLVIGQSATLKLNGVLGKASWSSSNKNVATVTSSGKVTAKKIGTTTITAKVDSKKYNCKVTVKKKTLSADVNKLTMSKGSEAEIIITLKNDQTDTLYLKIDNLSDPFDSVVSYEFGDWNGDDIPVYITANIKGKANIIITTEKTTEKLVIPVTVK